MCDEESFVGWEDSPRIGDRRVEWLVGPVCERWLSMWNLDGERNDFDSSFIPMKRAVEDEFVLFWRKGAG